MARAKTAARKSATAKTAAAKPATAAVKEQTLQAQQPQAQKPEVQNVATVAKQDNTKPAANETGKPTTPATVEIDIEVWRKAFADSARADSNSANRVAVCADLFKPLASWEAMKEARRHAIYGYIHGRDGKRAAEDF